MYIFQWIFALMFTVFPPLIIHHPFFIVTQGHCFNTCPLFLLHHQIPSSLRISFFTCWNFSYPKDNNNKASWLTFFSYYHHFSPYLCCKRLWELSPYFLPQFLLMSSTSVFHFYNSSETSLIKVPTDSIFFMLMYGKTNTIL